MARHSRNPSSCTTAVKTKGNVFSSLLSIKAKDLRVQRALELIQSDQVVQIGDIAATLNLSASRFRHIFKEELGVSPRHYIRMARLERAKGLLESTFFRVKEIAALVGANDVSHFVRDYRVLYGHTPSQARTRRPVSTAKKRHVGY